MLVEIFIMFEIFTVGFFIAAFFTKQEILWAITAVLSGMLIFTSHNIEKYIFNNIAQTKILTSHSYSYLSIINLLFFMLTIILVIYDLFDKYSYKFAGDNKK